jgi:hypothetical protein
MIRPQLNWGVSQPTNSLMRIQQPLGAKGSLKWMQAMVATGAIDRAIADVLGLAPGVSIEWRSPRAEDDFAEYRDEAFLHAVGLDRLAADLRQFWPERGPQWDGLAVTGDGRVVLVEAKAHVSEMSSSCGAGPRSRERIGAALDSCKERLGARSAADWMAGYYQYANRLAHLQFLRDHGVKAELLFVYFLDDPDMGRTSSTAWAATIDACHDHLGLPEGTTIEGVHDLFVRV